MGLLIRQLWQKDRTADIRELVFRYAVYTLAVNLAAVLAMAVMCEEGTSFQAKMDSSPLFALKFVLVELAAAAAAAGAEWLYCSRRLTIKVHWREYRETGLGKFAEKILLPLGIYLAAAAVALLNIRLMSDNVLWGDECFSANTAQKSADGILQVLYFWDNHPPLYYYWLKMFGDLFGHTGPVYHLASLTPFLAGIVFAVTLLRRRFGNIPAGFFVIITGLASSCLQYNLEIRMYSLAFFAVVCCYYCAYRVLCGKRMAWFGMVFWALVGAYSHYYAMMTAGILIFVTGAAAAVRYRGRTWVKGLIALLAYIAGYIPWMGILFRNTSSVSNNWWMTEILGLGDSLQMIFGGAELEKPMICLLAVLLAALFLKESSFFQISRGESGTLVQVHSPRIKNWSDETYGAAVGILTIAGTLAAAYVLCLIIGPVLAQRYLYPLSGVTVVLLVICAGRFLDLAKQAGEKRGKLWLIYPAKTVLALALAAFALIGLRNYKVYSAQVMAERTMTEQALETIGEVPEDTALISNNVRHLSWTVLYYYYPDRKIVTGRCSDEGLDYDRFWYFTPEQMDSSEVKKMMEKGYDAGYYGTQQIATYPFALYYFEKAE